jgi:hypothetical protein
VSYAEPPPAWPLFVALAFLASAAVWTLSLLLS